MTISSKPMLPLIRAIPVAPLINVRGELIGINTAIVSGGGGSQGVGFAVPVNMAPTVMDQILKQGRVVRGSRRRGAAADRSHRQSFWTQW